MRPGSGFISVGDERAPIRRGERAVWPAGVEHCLWTGGTEVEVIVVERTGGRT